jgi:CrcB protein
VNVVAVLVGGVLGTALRLAIETLLPHGAEEFPWSTLLINVVGSFALGLAVARLWPVAPEWLRAGIGTGVLGSFTTFSAVAVSVVTLTTSDRLLAAAVYLVVSVVAGITAALLGLRTGRRPAPGIGPDE